MPSVWSHKIDQILLQPVLGLIILLTILFLMFQAVFSLATIPQGLAARSFDSAQAYVASIDPNSFVS